MKCIPDEQRTADDKAGGSADPNSRHPVRELKQDDANNQQARDNMKSVCMSDGNGINQFEPGTENREESQEHP